MLFQKETRVSKAGSGGVILCGFANLITSISTTIAAIYKLYEIYETKGCDLGFEWWMA